MWRTVARFGPLILAGAAAAVGATAPDLIALKPEWAGVIGAAAILLAHFAPPPHKP